jgi:long-chain acyl-CoA synthetase
VHLLCGPAYHTAPGMYAQMHLALGARIVIMEPFDAEHCLSLIETERVTTSHMVPANFVRILEADWRRYDLSSLRKVLHAAAPCPVPLKQQVMEVFGPGVVWEYYGMSEGMGTVISPEEWLRKPGSVGRAFPGLDVKILDEHGTELPTGEIGLIYVSAIPGYRFGYHNASDKTGEAWLGDYFTVGDLGRLDGDGYLFIADRRTDLIISGGVNIYPAEVEQALSALPDVVDAAVFGVPDERMGQRVHAVVELRDGAQHSVDDLLADLRESLAGFKVPRSVEFVDRLPREPNGKVLKRRLRDDYLTRATVS